MGAAGPGEQCEEGRCGGRRPAGPAALLWGFAYCAAGESGLGARREADFSRARGAEL